MPNASAVHVGRFGAGPEQLAALGRLLKFHPAAALAVAPLEKRHQQQPDLAAVALHTTGESAAMGSCRYWRRSSSAIGSGREIRKYAGERNHLRPRTRGQVFHGQPGPVGFAWTFGVSDCSRGSEPAPSLQVVRLNRDADSGLCRRSVGRPLCRAAGGGTAPASGRMPSSSAAPGPACAPPASSTVVDVASLAVVGLAEVVRAHPAHLGRIPQAAGRRRLDARRTSPS